MNTVTSNLSWRLKSFGANNDGLIIDDDGPPSNLGDHDCLVRIEAASLNYRDVMISEGSYPFPLRTNVVLGSDGAGVVIARGDRVTRFVPGDHVCTTLSQDHVAGSPTSALLQVGTGGTTDGVLRQYGTFEEHSLVKKPSTLNFRQASTLPCAALTAWNALYGLQGRPVRAGDYVLTLGTGGVSLFALQFAVAAGAVVVTTTSSASKAMMLKKMGASHVVNYNEDSNWGTTVKNMTPDANGVDFIVEVGGPSTLKQSLAALKMDGVMAVVGSVAGSATAEQQGVPSFLDAWLSTCTVWGIAVGSRAQFEEMKRAITSAKIQPILDSTVFGLDDLKEALQHLAQQKHIGKVVIDCQQLKEDRLGNSS